MDNQFSLKTIFKDYVRGTIQLIQKRQLFLYAAQSSFFIVTSFVPFIILVISIGRLFGLDINTFIDTLEGVTPHFINSALDDLMHEDMYANASAIIPLAAISIVWSAAKAVQGISYGLNNLLGINENRNYFVLRYRAILYTLIFIFLMSGAVLFSVYGHNIIDILMVYFNVETTPFLVRALLMTRYIITFALMMLFFTLIYAYFPGQGESVKSRIFTGLVCAVAWCVFTIILGMYVRFFKAFTLYGSMFMILLWLLWLYICMSIFFICGMCYPMINYLFACLNIKLHGGFCKDVPMPEHTGQISDLGRSIRESKAANPRSTRAKRLRKEFIGASVEPIRHVVRGFKRIFAIKDETVQNKEGDNR